MVPREYSMIWTELTRGFGIYSCQIEAFLSCSVASKARTGLNKRHWSACLNRTVDVAVYLGFNTITGSYYNDTASI